ncbi:MAG TPA: hypothetical protein VH351_21885 [Bryobacteraceae bacterium]|jgi:hypothetical protein|nr:hypothetical protein [Bryobacteraceae bacterium]
MKIQLVLQYATLISILIAGLGIVVAVCMNRAQVRTQIFLALSAQYDQLVHSSSSGVWLSMSPDTVLPERTDDLTISALRFCTLVSITYYLYREGRIPPRMWTLMLRSAERRMRNPVFVREWDHLRLEFESFPEFVTLVSAVQNGTHKRTGWKIGRRQSAS